MAQENLVLSSFYVAGLLSFFSPCIFPVIPIYLSILSKGGKKSIFRMIAFVLGLSVTFIVLGFGAGLIGEIFRNEYVRIAGGLLVITMGLFQLEVFQFGFMERTKLFRANVDEDSIFAPFLLGLTFSLGWTPCVGPVLASIVHISESTGNVGTSLLTMTLYMLGLATPFVIFSLASEALLKKTNFIKKHLMTIKKLGGVLLIIMGLLLTFNKLTWLLF